MLSRERQAVGAATRIYKQGRGNQEKMIRVAVDEMLNLGGLYVKFAQLLLLNQTLAKSITPALHRKVFDRVHVAKNDGLRSFMSAEDLHFLKQNLKAINYNPAYAGSFAVVFDAVNNENLPVIIKVLRPNIRKNLKKDLRLVSVVAKPLSLFSEEIKIALQDTLKLFRETTLSETNYLQEIQQAKQLELTFRSDEFVHIPRTFENLSNNRYIVQEKLEGVWLSEVMERSLTGDKATDYVSLRTGSDLRMQLHHLGFSSLCQTLLNNPVHGDPHPGNIVLMSGNRVGLIDFGIVAYPLKNRLALLEYVKEQIKGMEGDIDLPRLMISIVRFHANYLYRAVQSLSDVYKRPLLDELYALLTKEINSQTDNIDSSLVAEGEYSNMLSGNINEGNRFALAPKLDSPLTQKAFLSLWRTNDELGMRDVTLQVFKDAVKSIEESQTTYAWGESAMPPQEAYQIIMRWLSTVADKDPALFQQLKKLFMVKPMEVK